MFQFNAWLSQYSGKAKEEDSIIRNAVQPIAVKILEIKFDCGFEYEHFSEPIHITGFLKLHKVV